MYYKKDDKGIWWEATTVHLPSGDVLTPENKLNLDGWEWLEEEPLEFTEWKLEQEDEQSI